MERDTTRLDEPLQEVSLLAALVALRRDWKFISVIVAVVTILAVAYVLLAPRYFASKMALYPAGAGEDSPLGQLQGIASSIGLTLPASSSQINVPDVLRSRRLRKGIAETEWKTKKYPDPVNLVTYWKWDRRSPEVGLDKAIRKLARLIRVTEETTGLVRVSVEMPEREMARDVAVRLLGDVQDYVQTEYRTVASLNQKFIEERLIETREDLREAEESLKEFLETNRRIEDSPELQLAYGRLTREVEVRQEVFITLRQQNEIAKIGEIRETPVINILDAPEIPVGPSRPKRRLIVVGAFCFSIVVGCFLSLFRNRMVDTRILAQS
jgi:uncharacterized protein involved in exopolysaccharide biosynthesis